MLEEYEEWFDSLDEELQHAIYEDIIVLEGIGPTLGRPTVDTLYDSKLSNLKELRTNYNSTPYRSLFLFDVEQSAVFLVGGDKTSGKGSEKKWYKKHIAIAEKRYKAYLKSQKEKK